MDEEFNPLFNKLTDSACDMTAEKHVDTHVQTCSSLPAINSDMADWKVSSVKGSMTEYLRKQWSDLNKAASDNEDDIDDDDANSKDIEVVEIGTGEVLTMFDWLINLKDLSIEERNSLVAMKDKLEKIRVWTKAMP